MFKKHLTKLVTFIVACIVVGSYIFIPEVTKFFDEAWSVLSSGNSDDINSWIATFGCWGPIILIVAMILQMFLIVIPSLALMIVSVIAYGPLWGSVLIYVSVSIASTVGFYIGKYFAKFITSAVLGTATEEKIEKFIANYGFWAVIVTRLNPFLSNDAISFVAGIIDISYPKFIGATLIGITPLVILIAITGGYMDQLKIVLLWISIISVLLFVGYLIYSRIKNEKSVG
ncbi:TVP38/TMEM64 family protein [Aquimarina sp. 2-A2]|uniref:TVP38/TMEM64 family protein n=1 Tax=Aquimarina sp. 2-A2 TaxID=3382644 RepID=UPI00388E7C9F